MITDSQIAQSLVSLYAGSDGFDYYQSGRGDSGICWGLRNHDEAGVPLDEYEYYLRGSRTLEDWLRDLIALATPFEHNEFGPVHPGFLLGMADACTEMLSIWDRKTPIVIAGHSLGAGRAAIATAIFLQRGVPANLMRRVVFGEPKPGLPPLAQFIAAVTARSYRNGTTFHHDAVTDFPLTLPPFENYVHPCQMTFVDQPPESLAEQYLNVFGFHHMPLYAAALAKLATS
jgi:hypothetical protein